MALPCIGHKVTCFHLFEEDREERRYLGTRLFGTPIACWITMKRRSNKRNPSSFAASDSSCCLKRAATSAAFARNVATAVGGVGERRISACLNSRVRKYAGCTELRLRA